jgi:PIN domain nuclease of toxin-antitoxin system
MRFLADTCVMLWWLSGSRDLAPFQEAICDPDNEIFYSAVSVAEVSIKTSLGRLIVPNGYVAALEADGFSALPFTPTHGRHLAMLPWHHRDPFDRMLIAQAQVEGLRILTADKVFRDYEETTEISERAR